MRIRRTLIILPLLALTISPGWSADAENKQKQPAKKAQYKADRLRRGTEDSMPRSTQGHRAQDLNGDGVITRNEWPGNDKSFQEEDRNHDGVITDADRMIQPKGSAAKPTHPWKGQQQR